MAADPYAERGGAGPGERALPSLPDVVFLAGALVTAMGGGRQLLHGDGDLASHIRIGEWILENRALPSTHPFSITMAEEPFLAHSWLGEVLLAGVHSASGLAGVLALAAVLVSAAFTLQFRYLVRNGTAPAVALLAAGTAFVAASVHWVARAHLFTWLAVVLLFLLLEQHATKPPGSGDRPRLAALAGLFVLWTNLHGGFLLGIMVIVVYLGAAIMESLGRGQRRPWLDPAVRRFAAVLALAGAASVVNPMGPRLHLAVVGHLADASVISPVNEFMSPDFHRSGPRVFLLLLLGSLAALGLSRTAMPLRHVGLVLLTAAQALYAMRNIPYFALLAVPPVVLLMTGSWPVLRSRITAGGPAWRRATRWPHWLSAATLAVFAAAAFDGGRIAGATLLDNRFSLRHFPVEAVERARAGGLHGRVYATMTWAGYVLYAWPGQPVYVDGLAYTGPVISEYLAIRDASPGWRAALRSRDIDVVLVEPRTRLARALHHEPGWLLWHCDAVASLWIRRPVRPSDGGADEAPASPPAECPPGDRLHPGGYPGSP